MTLSTIRLARRRAAVRVPSSGGSGVDSAARLRPTFSFLIHRPGQIERTSPMRIIAVWFLVSLAACDYSSLTSAVAGPRALAHAFHFDEDGGPPADHGCGPDL